MEKDIATKGQPYLQWTSEQSSKFGLVAQSTRHRAHELPWLDDAGLIRLIDEQPRTLYIATATITL